MTYRLQDTAAARRDLQALPRDILLRVEARIQALAENPRPLSKDYLLSLMRASHVLTA